MARDKTIREFNDKNSYVLNWLTAGPSQQRSNKSLEFDMDKRLDAILTALLKENINILPFKPREK